jgi:hypothetical protein
MVTVVARQGHITVSFLQRVRCDENPDNADEDAEE